MKIRFLFLTALLAASTLRGFDYIRDSRPAPGVPLPFIWANGPIPMKIMLGTTPTLSDGSNFSTSVQTAMQIWNPLLGASQFQPQIAPVGPGGDFNLVNEMVFSDTVFGRAFGDNTLAVTTTIVRGNERGEADIVFNNARTWDSYRGPVRSGINDIQRVAIHELGHALGLDHPDQATPVQSVQAIMNSRVSNQDTVASDDIAGAQGLYGPPGVPANDAFANATPITLSGNTAVVTGFNTNTTKEPGEPNHGGDPGGHSAWWRFTAPSNGNISIDTRGSVFDTTLGVYTGSAVNALTTVASNDDITSGSEQASSVAFSATAGTTYRIAIDGFQTRNGVTPTGGITINFTFNSTDVGVVTTQPSSQTVTPGGTATFTVASTNNPTGFQWFFGSTAISGATTATLTVTNVQASNGGPYHVVITNAAGTLASNNATLTVLASGVLNQTVTTGHNVSFSAAGASGSVQWQISTDGGNSFTNLANGNGVSGATSTTLDLSGVNSTFNGFRYRYVVTTNGGTSTSNAATLTVQNAFLPHPTSVGVDGAGVLYVGDSSTDTIQKISTALQITTLAGSPGLTGTTDGTGTTARFNLPNGLVAASDGSLSVSDTANATIRRVSAAGAVTTLAGSASVRGNADGTGTAATFNAPVGIAADAAGNLYVADSMNHTVRKVTTGGVVTTFAGTAGSAGSADGTGAAARFNQPTGLAVDTSGNVYVADTTNNTLRKITAAGAVSTLAGVAGVSGSTDGTGSAALFNRPGGLAIDSGGNIYLADTGNSTVRKITPAGAVTTLAGLPTVAGLRDGTGSDVFFNQPEALALDTSGNVYVADTGNATIRKITSAGAVTTLALIQGVIVPPPPVNPPPVAPPPSGGGGGGGGGGGAPSTWFLAALSLLALGRRKFLRRG
ncbi:MAG: matrixin family metalloprotease [Opitutae bacterium]|nr:matrixin family metalloprotease [Opitutae bacterium]